ncbi:MAG: hypothetical protein WCS86_00910 [Candidatus Paceibacterota bacterium]
MFGIICGVNIIISLEKIFSSNSIQQAYNELALAIVFSLIFIAFLSVSGIVVHLGKDLKILKIKRSTRLLTCGIFSLIGIVIVPYFYIYSSPFLIINITILTIISADNFSKAKKELDVSS